MAARQQVSGVLSKRATSERKIEESLDRLLLFERKIEESLDRSLLFVLKQILFSFNY